MSTEHDVFMRLRTDAVDRGMLDLAIVYGWSACRIGEEMLAAGFAKLSPACQEALKRYGWRKPAP